MDRLQPKLKAPQERAAAAAAVVRQALVEVDSALSRAGEAAELGHGTRDHLDAVQQLQGQHQQDVVRGDAAVAAAEVEGMVVRVVGVRREVGAVTQGLEEGLKQMQQQQRGWGRVLPALIDASAALTAARQQLGEGPASGVADPAQVQQLCRQELPASEKSRQWGQGLDDSGDEEGCQEAEGEEDSRGGSTGSGWEEEGAGEEGEGRQQQQQQQAGVVPHSVLAGLRHVEQQLSRSLDELVDEPRGWLAGRTGQGYKGEGVWGVNPFSWF